MIVLVDAKVLFAVVQAFKVNKITAMSFSNVYHSVNSVLTFLKDDKHKDNKTLQEELAIYQSTLENENLKIVTDFGDTKKHPLIVVEGLDGSGKTSTTRNLAKKFNAELRCTPPNCISHLRFTYENEKYLRAAFYSLGNYIAALEIRKLLETKPVILDRFWHSTAAYEMALSIKSGLSKGLPLKGDDVYRWPQDLLKPDVVLYLSVSEDERLRRHKQRNTTNTLQEILLKTENDFRYNVEDAYKNMFEPTIEIIDSNGSIDQVVETVEKKIKHLFH